MKIYVLIFSLFCGGLNAQDLLFKSTFNDGDSVEDQVMGFDGTKIGTSRTCGVVDFGRAFDGASAIIYPEDIAQYLASEFTLSFYLQIENDPNGTELVNIFSARDQCSRDTAFMMTYFPTTRMLSVEFWENNNPIIVATNLSEDDCWHHIVVTYDIASLRLYVNGEEKQILEMISRPIVIDSTVSFGVSSGPCIGLTEIELEGKIDELCIFDDAMDIRQVQALNLRPDKILTRDTSIFNGGAVPVQVGPICTSDFDWSPQSGLSSNSDTEPILTPDETTTYSLTLDYGFCQTQDSIVITVIDESDIACEDISLPTAFTPNNDLLNDDFGISNPILIEELKSFEIFDKWGAKMWETIDKNASWDGRFRGVIPNTNTYLYRINYNCKGEEHFKSGSFTILR